MGIEDFKISCCLPQQDSSRRYFSTIGASSELSGSVGEIEKQKTRSRNRCAAIYDGFPRAVGSGRTDHDPRRTLRHPGQDRAEAPCARSGARGEFQRTNVFLEPLETIEQNNKLVRLLDEEQAEVQRILIQMTRRISESAEAIRMASVVLSELELSSEQDLRED